MATIEISNLAETTSEENLDDKLLNEQHFSKHDSYVEKLSSEIKGYYDKTITHYTIYSKSKKTKRIVTKGEVDILCFKGRSIHAYEVKCSNRLTKAKHQLKKIKKNLLHQFSGFEIKVFFYCGSSENLVVMD